MRPSKTTSFRLVSVLLAGLVIGSACSSTKKQHLHSSPGQSGIPSQPSSPGGSGAHGTLPLGQVRDVPTTPALSKACPRGDQCTPFGVRCPGVQQDDLGILDIGKPPAPATGMVVFFSGGGGRKLWFDEAKNDLAMSGQPASDTIDQQAAKMATDFLHALQLKGLETVQVSWQVAWLESAPGERAGPARLACRSASVIQWIHDTLYKQLGAHPSGLACGYCLTGNSGGASEIAYSLAFYGLSDMVQAAVLTGGPPHAYFDRACLDQSGWGYTPGLDSNFDASYGFPPGRHGPCATHDQSWAQIWQPDDIIDGGSTFTYPHTRILLILGAQDPTQVGPHQLAYFDRLRKANNPDVRQVTVPNMGHAITASSQGLGYIKSELLKS